MCYIDYKTVEKPLPWEDLIVEIGFGRGDFTVKLAKENPDKKIIGFELSAISVEKLIKRVKKESLKNVHCVRIDAYWGFYLLLKDSSVEKIYMNYPDPWFKKRHHKRRLTKEENLYIFARKLKENGEIRIRTDFKPFVDFTLEEAQKLSVFDISVRKLEVEEPLTKYERKWLLEGKELTEIIMRKIKDPEPRNIPALKEVRELFPVKVEGKELDLKSLEGSEIKLGERVYLKFFKSYGGESGHLVETLLSEEGFLQKFFILVRRKGKDYVVDVSPFSEVLRTENVQRAVQVVAEKGFKPLSHLSPRTS